MIRWSCPSSSPRGYFDISTNLSLTNVISPLTFVVATIAAWLRAKFVSARFLVDWLSARPVNAYFETSHAVTQMPTIVNARLTIACVSIAAGGESAAANVVRRVATPAAHNAKLGISMKRPKRITTPYNAQTAMASGSERSRTKIPPVSIAARRNSRRSLDLEDGRVPAACGISNELGIGTNGNLLMLLGFPAVRKAGAGNSPRRM